MVQTTPSRYVVDVPPEYPSSDGQPMAEGVEQYQWITRIAEGLEMLYRERSDVFVAADLLWYPIEGRTDVSRAPDAMVVFGRPPGLRPCYVQHLEEGIAPQVVFEIWSPSNTEAEMKKKREFYELHGVEEYYEYNPPRRKLKGWVRKAGRLQPIPQIDEGWTSPLMDVHMVVHDELVLTHPDGKRFCRLPEMAVEMERKDWLLEQSEKEQKRLLHRVASDRTTIEVKDREIAAQIQKATEERQRAESERQRAEEERQKAESERQRAEEERQKAEAERQRAAAEKQRADELEAKLAKLQAMVAEQGKAI